MVLSGQLTYKSPIDINLRTENVFLSSTLILAESGIKLFTAPDISWFAQ